MKQINIDDEVYEQIEKEATRLHLDVDTYLSTVLMREAGESQTANGSMPQNSKFIWPEVSESVQEEIDRRIREAGSPGKALIGLFSDIPEVMDAIVADAMAARSKPWRLPNDESTS